MFIPAIVGPANIETLTGTRTLTIAEIDASPIQVFDPDGARTVVLPAEADSVGRAFVLVNEAGGAEIITIQDDGSNTIVTPTQNEMAWLYCDGTTWRGFVAGTT